MNVRQQSTMNSHVEMKWCFCPFNKERCMGLKCKFWKVQHTLDDTDTSLSINSFMIECELTNDLNGYANLLVANNIELDGLYKDNYMGYNAETDKLKKVINTLREKVESSIKLFCQNNSYQLISCIFNENATSLEELGTVYYYGNSESAGECIFILMANKVLD